MPSTIKRCDAFHECGVRIRHGYAQAPLAAADELLGEHRIEIHAHDVELHAR